MRMLVILALAGLVLGGCAGPQTSQATEINDPYESTNRAIFDFNLKMDQLALRPTAQTYAEYVPERIRDGLHNALDNLHTPIIFANDVLQGEAHRAGVTAQRFLVNTTPGLGGLIDIATRLGLESHDEDFGQTLAVWGAGDGPYLMLPLFGPSNPRDTIGRVGDVALDPTVYLHMKRHMLWAGTRLYLTIVDERSRNLDAFDTIERDSLDFYATTRSLYRQHRASEIRNGIPPKDD